MQHESEEVIKLIIFKLIKEHISKLSLDNDEIKEFIDELKDSLKLETFTNKTFYETP